MQNPSFYLVWWGKVLKLPHLKTLPQVKCGEREQEKAPGTGVRDAVVTQGVQPKVCPVSHTSGTVSSSGRAVASWEMLNP